LKRPFVRRTVFFYFLSLPYSSRSSPFRFFPYCEASASFAATRQTFQTARLSQPLQRVKPRRQNANLGKKTLYFARRSLIFADILHKMKISGAVRRFASPALALKIRKLS
jgi:hypothetical protein